jgi:REP element-mobilizing transposase RayT
MSYVRVWIHAVWGTKYRETLLNKTVRPVISDHIIQHARKKGFFIDTIDGYTDHLHCLFALNPRIALSTHLQFMKGESSYWINKHGILDSFGWADEYFAGSVSEQNLNKIRNYIKNQEKHHKKLTFQEEYELLLREHNMEKVQG